SPVGALDELYWKVTGNKWSMFIDSVHARVVLPEDINPTQVAVYTGYARSTASDAAIERDANEVGFASRHPLYPYAGMTIGVGWPAGHISGRPSPRHEQLLRLARCSLLLRPLV